MSSIILPENQTPLTLGELLDRLLPHGSVPFTPNNSIKSIPLWPPDLFAVTAAIVDLTGCYSQYRYISGPHTNRPDRSHRGQQASGNGRFFTWKKIAEIGARASVYGHFNEERPRATNATNRRNLGPKQIEESWHQIDQLWSQLLKHRSTTIADIADEEKQPKCRDALMELLSMADCAADTMGFFQGRRGTRPFADLLIDEYGKQLASPSSQNAERRILNQLPYSICLMVPTTEVCVQPKTMTPQCGCTLRSLSHNLALLPPSTKVRTRWTLSVSARPDVPRVSIPYNILLVPYPYIVDAGCICDGGDYPIGTQQSGPRAKRSGFFEVKQRWLEEIDPSAAKRGSKLATFVAEIGEQATNQVNHIDMVVFPELALDKETSDEMAKSLLANVPGLECLIAGVLSKRGPLHVNAAQTYVVTDPDRSAGDSYTSWQQAKHHRWKLDSAQIGRYHLGGQLDPVDQWWEHIDLRDRSCYFFVFRHGMSLATLVCEDLARVDPVQAIIRSIGPNLVIALLMDGPQLEHRWGGRYATVLADDPGSAVLTLTSAGMVARSVRPGEAVPREIALWKGKEGITQELKLPAGDHALLLTVTRRSEEQFTLDGRSDDFFTHRLEISGVHGLRHPKPPEWAKLSK